MGVSGRAICNRTAGALGSWIKGFRALMTNSFFLYGSSDSTHRRIFNLYGYFAVVYRAISCFRFPHKQHLFLYVLSKCKLLLLNTIIQKIRTDVKMKWWTRKSICSTRTAPSRAGQNSAWEGVLKRPIHHKVEIPNKHSRGTEVKQMKRMKDFVELSREVDRSLSEQRQKEDRKSVV